MLIIQLKMVNLYGKYIEFDRKWWKITRSFINLDIFDQIQSFFDINQHF